MPFRSFKAELLQKAFDETLQQVLKDTKDFTHCFEKLVKLRDGKRAEVQAAEALRQQQQQQQPTLDSDDAGASDRSRAVPDLPETHRDFFPRRRKQRQQQQHLPPQQWRRQQRKQHRAGLIVAQQGEFDALHRAILVDLARECR